MRVLLVEDDADLADVVLLGLRQEHLAVDHAPTVAEAIDALLTTTYDVVCLDLGLPDGDGLELCRRVTGAEEDSLCVAAAGAADHPDRTGRGRRPGRGARRRRRRLPRSSRSASRSWPPGCGRSPVVPISRLDR